MLSSIAHEAVGAGADGTRDIHRAIPKPPSNQTSSPILTFVIDSCRSETLALPLPAHELRGARDPLVAPVRQVVAANHQSP